jgi:hypothetical protein
LSVDAQEFVPRSEDWAMSDGFAEDVRQGKLEVEREERAVRIIVAFFRRVRWKKRRCDKAAARAGRDTAAGSAQAGALAAGNIEQFDRFQRLRRYVRACSCVCAHARTCTETLRSLACSSMHTCTHTHTHTPVTGQLFRAWTTQRPRVVLWKSTHVRPKCAWTCRV